MTNKELEFKIRAEVFLRLGDDGHYEDARRQIREVIDYCQLAARRAEKAAANTPPSERNPAAIRIRERIRELEDQFEEGMYGLEHHLAGLREALALVDGEES